MTHAENQCGLTLGSQFPCLHSHHTWPRNWTVSNAGGKIQVRFRPSEGKAQAARLPLLWEQGNVNRATLLINRAAKALLDGSTDSLTAAIAIAQGNSTTMRIGVNWEEVAEGLRDVLMNHRNEILAKTWIDNYEPYINEALRLINSGESTDGHTLLKNTLAKWAGKAPSRAACCIALRNLSDHAISRFRAAKSWQIKELDIKNCTENPPRNAVKQHSPKPSFRSCRWHRQSESPLGERAADLDLVWIASD